MPTIEEEMMGVKDTSGLGAAEVEAEMTGEVKPPSIKDFLKDPQTYKDIAGYAAGTAGQLTDMLLTIPRALSIPGSWGVSTSALAQGESPETAGAAALEYQERFLPEAVREPFAKIAKALGPESQNYYENNGVGWLLKHFGEGVEKGSAKMEEKTGVPASYTKLLVGQAMDLLGAKGVKASVKGVIKKYGAAEEARQAKKWDERMQGEPLAEKVPAEAAPGESPIKSLAQQHLEEAAAIDKPAAQAAYLKQRAKDVKNARTGEEYQAYKSAMAELQKVEPPKEGITPGGEELLAAEGSPPVYLTAQLRKVAKENGVEVTDTTTPNDILNALREKKAAGTVYEGPFEVSPDTPVTWNDTVRILKKPEVARTAADWEALRRFAEQGEPLGAELTAKVGEAPGWGDALRVLRKEKSARTAEDLKILTDFQKAGGKLGPGVAAGAAAIVGLSLSDLDAMSPEDAAYVGLIGAGMFGTVKVKGGVWAEGAVRGLSDALKGSAVARLMHTADAPPMAAERARIYANYDRMVTRWLNKDAGTETDPIRDIQIPFGEGTKSIGEITDLIIKPAGIPERLKMLKEGKAMVGEDIWDLDTGLGRGQVNPSAANRALQDYFSHAGDYAREFIPPEKLGQYDIPRLIKETATQDAKQAKAMEKARASGEGTVPYKTYDDGMKWVEVKSPEALKNEGDVMGHCVGGYCEMVHQGQSRIFSLRDKKGMSHVTVEVRPPSLDYTAWAEKLGRERFMDEQAKFKAARGTPAGHWPLEFSRVMAALYPEHLGPEDILQIKGKQNRAPNAEYLPYVQDFVKSGKWGEVGDLDNAGLFRGAKGKYLTREEAEAKAAPWLEAAGFKRESISRLSNRALDQWLGGPELAMPQILADLGLERVDNWRPEVQRALRERFGDRPHYTVEQVDAVLEARAAARPQGGSADPRILFGLGTIGLGGIAGSLMAKDPFDGMILGALGGLALNAPGAKARFAALGRGTTRAAVPISTTILERSPALLRRLLDHRWQSMARVRDNLNVVVPWMQESVNITKAERAQLDRALFAGDSASVATLNAAHPELGKGWAVTRRLLDDLGAQAKGLGRFKELLEDYFPRRVKDYEGLKNALGQEVKTRLETLLREAENTALKHGRAFTEVERDAIINRELRNTYRPQGRQPSYAKARGLPEVTEILQKYYHTPQEALYSTIREITKDLEMAKLFGKDLVQTELKGRKYINVDQSVGNIVGREIAEGRMKPEDQLIIQRVLRTLFGPGEQSPTKLLQELKAVGYAGTIGDVMSTLTQLGDPLLAVYTQGPRATITAIARIAAGNKKISREAFGLADHVAEEIAGGSTVTGQLRSTQRAAVAGGAAGGGLVGYMAGDDAWDATVGAVAGGYIGLMGAVGAANALNKIFKHTMFSKIDGFGKDVQLNAAIARLERLAQSAKGQVELKRKYGEAYMKDFPQLVADLQAGRMTDLTRSVAFWELSRIQPVSALEMPEMYLQHPNGRIAWQLKTFMIKQADIIHRDAILEMKKGNVARGIKNLTTFSVVLGLSGAAPQLIKDWLMGKSISLEAADVLENVLKTFGFSQYVRDKVAKGESFLLPLGLGVPAFQMIDRARMADPRAVQHIPVIGKLYYSHELGGKERSERQQILQSLPSEIRDERKAILNTPANRRTEEQRARLRAIRAMTPDAERERLRELNRVIKEKGQSGFQKQSMTTGNLTMPEGRTARQAEDFVQTKVTALDDYKVAQRIQYELEQVLSATKDPKEAMRILAEYERRQVMGAKAFQDLARVRKSL